MVGAERGGRVLDELVGDDEDGAIAAVTAAELLLGVELARGARKHGRARDAQALLGVLPIEVYDLEVAREHAKLMAHVRRAGRRREAHDLIIAATAAARSRIVVTADARGFADLPRVALRTV